MRNVYMAVGAVLAAAALALSGCATGAASTDLQFTPDSERAIVVIGVEGFDQWRGMSALLHYRGVDASGNFERRNFSVSNGNGWMPMESTEYFVVEVDPGTYVASGMMTHTGYSQINTTFCLGTISFVAPAGQAVYVGNLQVPRMGASILPRPPNMEAAAAKLSEYPGVQQSLTPAVMQDVPYPPSRMCDRRR